MDDNQLKAMLSDKALKAPDENAKKAALNLAMNEFDTLQKKQEKKRQGFRVFSRLMGRSTQTDRRPPMNKRLVFSGMATAMVVVLAVSASITYQAMHETIGVSAVPQASLSSVEFSSSPTSSGKGYTSAQRSSQAQAGRKEVYRQDAEKKSQDLRFAETLEAEEMPAPLPGDKVARLNKNEGQVLSRKLKQAPAEVDALAMADVQSVAPSKPAIMNAPASEPITLAEKRLRSLEAGVIDSDDEVIDQYYKDVGRDQFEDFKENPIKLVSEEPISTFSIDVDTSSYSFMRRQINSGVLPQKDAIRIEELINYFDYDYPQPESAKTPFKHSVVITPSPWNQGQKLLHIGIKGYDITDIPRSNLVFLLDVSGSMNSPDKLPLMVNSMKLLLDSLQPEDTVGIVVYAGAAGTVLEPTEVKDKHKIIQALDRLNAGGSTAGAEGIRQAYQLAESRFDENAVNRVILATDGDFNVGITNKEELKDFIERKRKTGIFLSVFGFGQGNYNDHLMQELAQNGNGIAAYIDNLNEARKVLVEEATSTLFPIAKDVKIQIEFNPQTVDEYRLIGYETRHLEREDFNNDAVDAGDIGAGHTVTAIYEIAPKGKGLIGQSRYQSDSETQNENAEFNQEYAFLKMRYKLPDEDVSKLITTPVTMDDDVTAMGKDIPDWIIQETGWSTAVASFGQLLKGGKYVGSMDYDDVIDLALLNKGEDTFGYRAEFINLVRLAKSSAALQKN